LHLFQGAQVALQQHSLLTLIIFGNYQKFHAVGGADGIGRVQNTEASNFL
jgi:hypothetical protein